MSDIPQIPGIEVFAVDSAEQLADCLPNRRKYFTLLLAGDTTNSKPTRLMEFFRPLVDRGLAYFCAWGNQCEDVHDAVDLCVAERGKELGQANCVVMTTWHEDEPLEEALWFFQMLAIPDEELVFSDFERFAVSIGNPEWAEMMRRYFANQGSNISQLE